MEMEILPDCKIFSWSFGSVGLNARGLVPGSYGFRITVFPFLMFN